MNKLLSLLGLARRAGKLIMGFDATVESMRAGGACGVLLAGDISPKTAKNLLYEAAKTETPVLHIAEDIASIGKAIGKKAGVISVEDQGFWKALQNIASVGSPTVPQDQIS